jgi:hypothetical protein
VKTTANSNGSGDFWDDKPATLGIWHDFTPKNWAMQP